MRYVIFSDLDGTLVDENYSFKKAKSSLRLIKKRQIPVVFCTSKTRTETELWREKLENNHPFIVENGGAIFIPHRYFDIDYSYTKKEGGYKVIELGVPYQELRQALLEIKKSGIEVKGFADMSAQEVAELTGLSLLQAELARQREYDEPFIIQEQTQQKIEDVKTILGRRNLNFIRGGIFNHILGGSDKGKAVRVLAELYKQKWGGVFTVGIGDSENDFPMLDAVKKGFLVRRLDGSYASDKYLHEIESGPAGWDRVVKRLFGG